MLPDMTELEEHLIHLEHLDEQRRGALTTNQAHKNRVKTQYDKEPLGVGKFKAMWLGPYVVSKVLSKGAYELLDFDGNKLPEPRNGLYLKKYYA